jgi:HTH-type transcriptional regulator, cell division transcriptional repressor
MAKRTTKTQVGKKAAKKTAKKATKKTAKIASDTAKALTSGPTLGGRIQLAREMRGLSAAQLARRAGILLKTLGNWESDRSEPRANKLQMLAGVLSVPPMWLLGGAASGMAPEFGPDLEETADLASKVDRLIKLHERMSTLLFEVQSEISRLQTEIEDAPL